MESPLIILGRLIRHLNKVSGEILYSYEPEINEFGDLVTLIFLLAPFRYQFHENVQLGNFDEFSLEIQRCNFFYFFYDKVRN